MDAIRIDIVSDVVCPWCVVGYQQLESALRELQLNADIYWQPFELNPAMAAEGEPLDEHIQKKYGIDTAQLEHNREQLTTLGAEAGFPFRWHRQMRMLNSFDAHQLLYWAALNGRQHQLCITLFHCYFNRERDISDSAVLANAAVEAGLDYEEAALILEEQRYADAVRESQRFSLSRGISGVPAMIFGQSELLVGAQGVDSYKKMLAGFAPV